jgi:hypothetical protein
MLAVLLEWEMEMQGVLLLIWRETLLGGVVGSRLV